MKKKRGLKRWLAQRSSLLRNILYIMIVTVLLLVGLIALLFSILGKGIYVQLKADELMPKAESIAEVFETSYGKNMTAHDIRREILSMELAITDAAVYVLDRDGNSINDQNAETVYDETHEIVKTYFDSVISGERLSMTSEELGVVVGVPAIASNKQIIGAVFIIMPVAEVQNTLQDLTVELCIATIGIAAIMVFPIYMISRKITKPIKRISDTALNMAAGNLAVRANAEGSYEAKHLANSFNILAEALQGTINDLIIERNRLKTVLDGLGEGIISVEKSGVITHYNSASVSLLGGKEDELPASLPAYAEVATGIMKVLDTNTRISTDFKLGDKSIRTVITPVREDTGNLCGAVALIRDVTESERLEQTRREYVANVSHELRTPLASIRSLADALNDGLVKDEDDRKRYYGYILRESIRLSNLISDLLELSRLQSGGVAFTKNRIELYEIAYDVCERMNDAARKRGKRVRLLTPVGEYFAHSNGDRIEQILVALVDNSIKHGSEECCVDVSFTLDEVNGKYVFNISNPAQIEPEDIQHLFERFYKADRAHSGEGTGIGLSIVSEVLNLLEEKISVDYNNGVISFIFTVESENSHE